MISKTIQTESGLVNTVAHVSNESGNTVITITSTLNGQEHTHRVTVGATDGNDATQSVLLADLQQNLDDARTKSANIVSARIKIANLAQQLT